MQDRVDGREESKRETENEEGDVRSSCGAVEEELTQKRQPNQVYSVVIHRFAVYINLIRLEDARVARIGPETKARGIGIKKD